ncbi:hypothetical protein IHE44_0008192, partial [Lamprotornis superbus]
MLQEQLDRQLQQRQARETGLCPVRRELYTQCFDELIRQTTVSCAERGLLLLRVRDELQLTLSAYQALYESSVAFGVRKALQAEQGKAHLENRIAELEEEKKELEKQVREEKAKCEAIERQETERREIEEKKHSEEVLFLKRTNQQLKKDSRCNLVCIVRDVPTFVSPAMGATLQTFLDRRVLITELLPTLGQAENSQRPSCSTPFQTSMGTGTELQHSHNRNKEGPQNNRQDCAYSGPGGNLAKETKHADVKQDSQNCHVTDTVGAAPCQRPLSVARRGTGGPSVKMLRGAEALQ